MKNFITFFFNYLDLNISFKQMKLSHSTQNYKENILVRVHVILKLKSEYPIVFFKSIQNIMSIYV